MTADDVEAFHRGDAASLDRCYRDHFTVVHRAVMRVLRGADVDATVHQVFYRLIKEPALRASFRGGNLAAWLTTIARNEAIDCQRRRDFETRHVRREATEPPDEPPDNDAKIVIKRFIEDRLPEKLRAVFEARFLRQLSQREAAVELDLARTTLAYQEDQIRALLREYVMERER